MARNKKYNTDEERRLAKIETAKKYYQKHKNEEEFIKRRKYYSWKYTQNLNVEQKDFLKEYNTDYCFYVRSIRSGRLNRRIEEKKQKVKELQEQIANMEKRLADLTAKYGHLEK